MRRLEIIKRRMQTRDADSATVAGGGCGGGEHGSSATMTDGVGGVLSATSPMLNLPCMSC
jgi:hypothetical protein